MDCPCLANRLYIVKQQSYIDLKGQGLRHSAIENTLHGNRLTANEYLHGNR